jgi:uncharacterized protein with NAD-binding domain and iron-sulfur cluster
MAESGRNKVVILGGGIAGMSAAHELIERGFQVVVLERKLVAGGKARSMPAVGPSRSAAGFGARAGRPSWTRPNGPPLPGEHGFRFFPGFYKHVVDTMSRIPYQGRSVAENLVDASEVSIAPFDRPAFTLPARFPRTPSDLRLDVFAIITALSGRVGVPLDEGFFFAAKIWQFLTSCSERRLIEYEQTNWWDFIEAGSRSEAYRKYFGNGITRSLVAAKAQRASTKTIGDIFMQIVFDILRPGISADRLLNGPTNDVWIDPWLAYLEEQGVEYHQNVFVRAIHCDRGLVSGVTVETKGGNREITGDYFIGALPVERMVELVGPELLACDPSLRNLYELRQCVEWMNGIQYFLTEDVTLATGHVIHVDSPWALTSVSQAQFWHDFDLTKYGDGTVKGILSVDISDWDVSGLNGKQARHCTREEIAQEVWEQLKKSLNVGGEVLRDDQLHSWFLDPDIGELDGDEDPTDGGSSRRVNTNSEPLLVNYVDTWRLRPEAVTRIPNFFLASDYVRTFTDLATMEAANEAARRAVNGILRAACSEAAPCEIWNLHEPEVFLPFRAYDRVRYTRGLPWDGDAMSVARAAIELARGATNRALSGDDLRVIPNVRQLLSLAPDLGGVWTEQAAPGLEFVRSSP